MHQVLALHEDPVAFNSRKEMTSLPIHKQLEDLAQPPYNLDPQKWLAIRESINALYKSLGADLDWSDEQIEAERGHVHPLRAHLYVLSLQYIAVRGTNKIMLVLQRNAKTDLEWGDTIQQACIRLEKTQEKYRPLRNLLGPEGAPESHGYFLTLVETRLAKVAEELQQQRERMIIAAARHDAERARRADDYADSIARRLRSRPLGAPATPEAAQLRLAEALDGPELPARPNQEQDMAWRVVDAFFNKLKDEDKGEEEAEK
jgi:hypothetical protein